MYLIAFGALLLTLVLLIIALLFMIIGNASGAPFVPTRKSDVKKMVEMADIKRGDVVYDLGSGDARLLIEAARRGAECVGIEINPILSFYSKFLIKLNKANGRIKIITGSYWDRNVGKANIVFLFLIPGKMGKMERKLKRELKKGTKVISNKFNFPGWEAEHKDKKSKIFLYLI